MRRVVPRSACGLVRLWRRRWFFDSASSYACFSSEFSCSSLWMC
jgi:hypothetical protein